MEDQQIIVLFGNSLLMDTVEASLTDKQALAVVRMYTNMPNIAERLQSLHPDLIVFDLDASNTQFIIPFLREQTGIPLVGLDITCSKVIALSSRHYSVYTAGELFQVIQKQISEGVADMEDLNIILN